MKISMEIEIGEMFYFCQAEVDELARVNLETNLVESVAHGLDQVVLQFEGVKCLQMSRVPQDERP